VCVVCMYVCVCCVLCVHACVHACMPACVWLLKNCVDYVLLQVLRGSTAPAHKFVFVLLRLIVRFFASFIFILS